MSYDETFIPDHTAHDQHSAWLAHVTATDPAVAAAWRAYQEARTTAGDTPFNVAAALDEDDPYLAAQNAAHATFAAWERAAEAAARSVWHEAAPATVGRLTAI